MSYSQPTDSSYTAGTHGKVASARTAASSTAEDPWPLAVLSEKLKIYIDSLSTLWVEGEVTELRRRPGARTQFFTLRDINADVQMNAMIYSHRLPETINPGDRVVVQVKISFYPKSGNISLLAQEIRPVGLGDMLARLEALKNSLAREGLFNPEWKKPLPFLPRSIGLVVGRNTDALRDVVVNTTKRWPVPFHIREVRVQGVGASSEVIAAMQELDALEDVDVIVLARGGGSFEDLLPFSDEALVRAIFATRTPVVSAIGHEPDTPLSDFVADMRASTPTDAAKRIVPSWEEEQNVVAGARDHMRATLSHRLERAQQDIHALRARPVLSTPHVVIDKAQEFSSNQRQWLRHHMQRILETHESALLRQRTHMRSLSPLATLERGYAIVQDSSGAIISHAAQVEEGAHVRARLARGTLSLKVTNTTTHKE